MMFYLVAENGPAADTRYPLTGPAIVMGRHPECDLVVDVGAVSRHHAQLVLVGDQYYVEDLNSRNGTYVNSGLLSGRHRLQEGDRIRVCDISFLFTSDPAGKKKTSPLFSGDSVLMEDEPSSGSIILSRLDVLSGSGSVALASTPESKLRALIEISRNLGGNLAIERVLPQVLESLFQLFVQADRGIIILRDDGGELVPRWSKLRRGDDDSTIRVSRTIVNEVVDTKQAILSADTAEDSRFQLSESIADFRIRSFMCAPLMNLEGRVLGALQIDSLNARNRFRPEDLELLVSVASQAAIAIDNASLHERLMRQSILERDLELAQQVQRGFLPKRRPKIANYRVHDFYCPADKVGGDYFDYVPLPDGRVAVVVADVVGHGVAASLLMAKLSASVRFCLATESDPAKAVTEMNRTLSEDSLEDRFITMIMVVLRPDRPEMTIVNAGHMPPLICRANGDLLEPGDSERGFPLLFMESVEYQQASVTLNPGDQVILYTDGLNESMNPEQELYGIDRLRAQASLDGTPEQTCARLIEDIRRFAAGAPQADDMCLVCFERH